MKSWKPEMWVNKKATNDCDDMSTLLQIRQIFQLYCKVIVKSKTWFDNDFAIKSKYHRNHSYIISGFQDVIVFRDLFYFSLYFTKLSAGTGFQLHSTYTKTIRQSTLVLYSISNRILPSWQSTQKVRASSQINIYHNTAVDKHPSAVHILDWKLFIAIQGDHATSKFKNDVLVLLLIVAE